MSQVALVTGASAGIGKEFARALSKRGYELVLVARRTERLEELANELPGKAHVVACDLAEEAGSLKGKVDALGLEVDLLVNNAGFGGYGRFQDIDPEQNAGEVRVNCEAVVRITQAFLPRMIERKRGGVINVASTAGMQPIPYEAVYSATKAFARAFTDALHMELKGTGVHVMSVNPGPVPTEFQDVSGYADGDGPANVPGKIGPEQVAAEALDAWDKRRRSFIPGRTIRWFQRVNSPAPTALKLRTVERMYRPKRRT